MKIIKAFIKSQPLLSYFTLVFAISWGAVLTVVGPGIFDTTVEQEQTEMLLPLAMLATLLGPSVAGILLTGLLYGRAGFRDLLTRMTRWRVGARWGAVALLTAPLSMMVVLFALSVTSTEFLPVIFVSDAQATLLLFSIGWGLMVGIFEELGWTGFTIPRMRLRYGVFATGLITGLLWGAWHFPVFFWGISSSSGVLPPALMLLVLLFSWLPPYRVLMVWVYDRTGSLLVAMLMHASLVASMFILVPLTLAGVALLTYDLVLAATLWLVVGAVALAQGGHFTRQPPLGRRKVA